MMSWITFQVSLVLGLRLAFFGKDRQVSISFGLAIVAIGFVSISFGPIPLHQLIQETKMEFVNNAAFRGCRHVNKHSGRSTLHRATECDDVLLRAVVVVLIVRVIVVHQLISIVAISLFSCPIWMYR